MIVADTFGADDVAPLAEVCGCCTVRVKLQGALRRRSDERQHGRVTRVVIETNEDVEPILRTFVTGRALGTEFYVENEPDLAVTSGTHRFVLTEDAALSWTAFSRFMATLMALRGSDLVRVNGLLNIENCRGPVAVQFMGHLASSPVELQAWPDDERCSRLAFVTRGVDESAIRSMFNAVRALS